MGKSVIAGSAGANSLTVEQVNSTAIARNAPCPCGSGKRYKDCHGAIGARAPEAPSADSLLREAQVAFATGSVTTAYELLGHALDLLPARADLLRERARIEWTRGEPSAAATCRAAIDRAPDDVAAWNLLGEILNANDAVGAEGAWKQALELDPQNAEALFHLGNREREQGQNQGATDQQLDEAGDASQAYTSMALHGLLLLGMSMALQGRPARYRRR